MSIYIAHYDWDVGGSSLEIDDNRWSISNIMINSDVMEYWSGGTSVIEVYRYGAPNLPSGSRPENVTQRVMYDGVHVAEVAEGAGRELTRGSDTIYVEVVRVMTKL